MSRTGVPAAVWLLISATSGLGIRSANTQTVAWHRLQLPVIALLPALAAVGCDLEEPIVEDGIESSEDPDGEELSEDPDGENPDGEDPDGEEPEDDGEPDGPGPDEDPDGPDTPAPPPAPQPDAAEPCDWEQAWGGYECETEDGDLGTQQCILLDGEEFWTPCSTEEPTCYAGDGEDYGCMGNICTWNGEGFEWYEWSEPDCNTPLVMNFDRGPVEFAPVAAATFDLSSNGTCTNTAWPTAPWLALDRDGDGFIRSGAELFGNATAMSSGGFAQHGFAALAELDSNFDGKISAEDERFDELVLWSDFDEDRIGAYAELRPIAETSLVSIDLGFTRHAQCDSMGNCGYERASFEYRRGESTQFGEVVDVHLLCQ